MALNDLYTNLSLLFRWLHVIAGITWIGMLYFFNFVNVPLQTSLADAAKAEVNPKLLPRALWWFRWGAKVTLVAGLILFVMVYAYAPGEGFGWNMLFRDQEGVTHRAMWTLFGMTLGTIMWFNVWFLIWPAQKKMLRGKAAAEELPALRRRVYLVSRTNAFLSGPMLFGMLAPSHYGAMDFPTLLVAAVVGVAAIFFAVRASHNVGKSA